MRVERENDVVVMKLAHYCCNRCGFILLMSSSI
jgi:hypothetical protein